MQRIQSIVTGASGFIGGHIAYALAEAGQIVIAPMRPHKELLLQHENIKTIEYSEVSKQSRFEIRSIIHCAALTTANCEDNNLIFQTNIQLGKIVVNWIKKYKPENTIFMSTVSVYGEITTPILKINTRPRNQNDYGRSKLIAEELIKEASQKYGCDLCILRLCGTAGYGSHGNLISSVLKTLSTKESKALVLRNPESLFNNIISIKELKKFVLQNVSEAINCPRIRIAIPASDQPQPFRVIIEEIHSLLNLKSKVTWDTSTGRSFTIDISAAQEIGFSTPTTLAAIHAIVSDIKNFESKG